MTQKRGTYSDNPKVDALIADSDAMSEFDADDFLDLAAAAIDQATCSRSRYHLTRVYDELLAAKERIENER